MQQTPEAKQENWGIIKQKRIPNQGSFHGIMAAETSARQNHLQELIAATDDKVFIILL